MMGREHLRNIALLKGTNVTVIYEPAAEMAQAASLLAPDAYFAKTIDELLVDQRLDCLVIASPNYCHVDQLDAIAEKVSLPILVEKPLFTTTDDLERIQAFQSSYKAPVWVAMEYRYMPPMQKFINTVDSVTGDIKLLTITEHRFPLEKVNNWNRFNENSGGTFVEKCCHFFDLMRLILRGDPVQVMASAGQEVNHLDEIYNDRPADIWDCGYVLVDFANGTRAMLELSMFAEDLNFRNDPRSWLLW